MNFQFRRSNTLAGARKLALEIENPYSESRFKLGGKQCKKHGSDTVKEISEEEIMNLTIDDFRDLTPQERQQDDYRRMFQMLGLIYKNQIEIKNLLALHNK